MGYLNVDIQIAITRELNNEVNNKAIKSEDAYCNL